MVSCQYSNYMVETHNILQYRSVMVVITIYGETFNDIKPFVFWSLYFAGILPRRRGKRP